MELVRDTLVRQRDQAFTSRRVTSQPKDVVVWTEEAEKRLANVPAFVRGMARKAIERYALEEGYDEITPEVMDQARAKRGG
ncbi:MAG: PCP reductase family protein [Chloroflexi bacterium]|nr:PCP reductase family protein [Chloroflexota bacterium]